jgi:hypothetical protein
MKFKLVNPLLKGGVDTTFSGTSSLEVADIAYKSLSQYFNNNVPKFYFTLEDENDKFHHFYVNETKDGSNADYTIKEYNVKAKYEKNLKKYIEDNNNNKEQEGGKKYHKHSSSSSSESWLDDSSSTGKLRYKVDPIVYWWYYPSVYRLTKFYVPTFVQSVTPYINIYLKSDGMWL